MDEFQETIYTMGFRHATLDISHEGLEYADRHATNLPDTGWYSTGYRTAVDAYKEGASR